LLLEPSRQNKLPYSQDFSQWSATSGGSVVSDQEGIGGSNDAFEFVSNGSANSRIFYTISATGAHSFSVFAKKNTLDYISLYANDDNNGRVWYNLADGTLGNEEGNATGAIEDYGNGWYRCTLKWTSSNLVNVRIYNSNANDVFGGTAGSVFIQYAQLEAGSYATSYIPTSGSAVTRSAETCNGAGNSNVFNDSEGVLYAEIAKDTTSVDGGVAISDSSYTNRVLFYFDTSGNIRAYVYSSGVQANIITSGLDYTQNNKLALKYSATSTKFFVNGFQVGSTDTSSTMPVGLSELVFDDGGGGSDFYGKVKDVRYYNTALSDSELQALTS